MAKGALGISTSLRVYYEIVSYYIWVDKERERFGRPILMLGPLRDAISSALIISNRIGILLQY
jgi:hypothetical protein